LYCCRYVAAAFEYNKDRTLRTLIFMLYEKRITNRQLIRMFKFGSSIDLKIFGGSISVYIYPILKF